ncbi:VENN motif pre-toxin domain-containing protein [Pseudodesulfovibrio sp.]|uniref:VENN motif pre-toxin domain-containing protein n=1 Tax=unclassified Pseudodesulfovibrio TaxID=2661612 RepID=UPI003B001D58
MRKDAELLSNVEGLEWMGDLLKRDDVDWQAVQEIHDKWSKSDGGLGPGGMLIISIIASAVTAGAASSLALAATGLEMATVNGVSTIVVSGTTTAASTAQLAMYTALTAGITSIGTQVITAAADAAAGGDFGKNFGRIASIEGVRSLAATMLLAGTLNAGATSGTFAQMGKAGEYMATVAIQAATGAIVGGEDLKESLLSAVGSAFGRYSAGKIDASELDMEMKIIMHGAAGAAGAALVGGDPYAGAMGAIVAELAAPAIDNLLFDGAGVDGGTGTVAGKTILAGSQIASVLGSALAGLDSGDAANAGRNAIMNNYLMPQEKKELVDKLEACGTDTSCKREVMVPYEEISEQRDNEFQLAYVVCKDSGNCDSFLDLHYKLRLELTKEGNAYYSSHHEEFVKLSASQSIWHTIQINEETGEPQYIIWGSNGNTKFVHPIYGYEVVINKHGDIVTNALNVGTYNFYNPDAALGISLLGGFFSHKEFDVNPYFDFGNSYDDPSSKAERYLRVLNLLFPN